jgi:hypothetical protein
MFGMRLKNIQEDRKSLKEMECESVDWILLVENSVHLGSFENTVMDLQIPKF